MSDSVVSSPAKDSTTPSRRGQSLVEFALILPMLLVLLLGVADIGRAFANGITSEALARNAAEAGAQEYVQIVRNGASGSLTPDDYARIHQQVVDVACGEAVKLPFKQTPSGTVGCMRDDPATPDPTLVSAWPILGVCVHDGVDPLCGHEAAVTGGCSDMAGWNNVNSGPAPAPGSLPLVHVEVRSCYHFTTLIDVSDLRLPFNWGIAFPGVYLQRDREFAVACYGDLSVECG